MISKTTAALQSRPSIVTEERCKNTTLISMVNQSPAKDCGLQVSNTDSQILRVTVGNAQTGLAIFVIESFKPLIMKQSVKLHFCSPLKNERFNKYLSLVYFELSFKFFTQADCNKSCSLLPQIVFVVMQDFKISIAQIITIADIVNFFIIQPLGSIPCLESSLRANAFSQLPRLTPSLLAASFNCWRSSGVIRIWKVGDKPSPFGVLSLLIVDMYVHSSLLWILLCTYVITAYVKKATPCCASNTYKASNHNHLSEVKDMAVIQHTQTHPKFTWRFMALSADGLDIVHIEAGTEEEARALSPAGHVIIFAGRFNEGVRHG